ncbi:MAG: ATP synthase F1 subunit delta [Chloroflexi bacterium RBG_13_52_14]|nr:MAG: ATP synthase F1 subunit delta [Chloroflexi bacterium RBG_13_52_14]
MARVASPKRHAQAVFQIALGRNEVDKWKSDLNTIASTLGDPQILAILEDPKIHFREKQQLVNKLLPGFSQLALNFAYFMVVKERLKILNQVVAEYEKMANSYQGLEHAGVTTAVPIEKEEREKLSERLAAITGKRILLTSEVNPSIIGGFIARVGDKLIDGSTRAKLEALKKKLIRTTV